MKQIVLVLAGAIAGGVLGYFGFWWLVQQGLYGLMLPGALLGLGAGIAKNRSVILAVLCGLAAVGLGLFAEWSQFPFIKDDSLTYFLLHVHELKPVTLLMILAGGVIAFWVPFGRIEKRGRAQKEIQQPPQST
jgi:hypothetical protein